MKPQIFLVALLLASTLPHQAQAECGIASVYFEGKWNANGTRFNKDGISAAHRTLPFGTKVRVRNMKTGREIVVPIYDRGPARYLRERIIDLSLGAAKALGMGIGLAHVCITR